MIHFTLLLMIHRTFLPLIHRTFLPMTHLLLLDTILPGYETEQIHLILIPLLLTNLLPPRLLAHGRTRWLGRRGRKRSMTVANLLVHSDPPVVQEVDDAPVVPLRSGDRERALSRHLLVQDRSTLLAVDNKQRVESESVSGRSMRLQRLRRRHGHNHRVSALRSHAHPSPTGATRRCRRGTLSSWLFSCAPTRLPMIASSYVSPARFPHRGCGRALQLVERGDSVLLETVQRRGAHAVLRRSRGLWLPAGEAPRDPRPRSCGPARGGDGASTAAASPRWRSASRRARAGRRRTADRSRRRRPGCGRGRREWLCRRAGRSASSSGNKQAAHTDSASSSSDISSTRTPPSTAISSAAAFCAGERTFPL